MLGRLPKLLIFEGIDGSGKSSIVLEIKRRLGDDAVLVRAPSPEVKAIIVDSTTTNIKAILILLADFSSLLTNEILPAIREGKTVLMDRFWLSLLVYQAKDYMEIDGRSVSNLNSMIEWTLQSSIEEYFHKNPIAEEEKALFDDEMFRIVIVDVESETAYERINSRGNGDSFDTVSLEEIKDRRARYLALDPERDMLGLKNIIINSTEATVSELGDLVMEFMDS